MLLVVLQEFFGSLLLFLSHYYCTATTSAPAEHAPKTTANIWSMLPRAQPLLGVLLETMSDLEMGRFVARHPKAGLPLSAGRAFAA